MPRAPRRKRDSAAHIYATCRGAGCPQDVINKIEQKTPADKILQWGSSAVYFGGSGVQLGKGTPRAPVSSGRATGRPPYRPLQPSVRPQPPVRAYGLPVISPIDAAAVSVEHSSIAVDGVVFQLPLQGPQGSVARTLHPGTFGDFQVVEAPTLPSVVVGEPVRPFATLPPAGPSAPGAGDPGIELQVFPGPSAPELVARPGRPPLAKAVPTVTSTSKFGNPAFEVAPSTADLVGESSAPEVIHVTEASAGGVHVSNVLHLAIDPVVGGAPDIELMDLGPPLDPEGPAIMEETPFMKTSTPVKSPAALAPSRPPGRLPRNSIWSRLFGRRVEQIPVMDDIFLDRPQDLVQFNNPAFEESVTMIFENDLRELRAAPNPDFQDIVSLSAPLRTQTDSGRIRLSRLGVRGNIQTRSGLTVGPQTHFYRELSTIVPEEVIEMRVFGEHTGASTVLQGNAETALATFPLSGDLAHPDGVPDDHMLESDLLPVDLHETLQGSVHESATVPVVTWSLPEDVPLIVAGIGGAVDVDYPVISGGKAIVPPPAPPRPVPPVLLSMYGSTYYLHPSLLRRKRKHLFI